MISTFYKGWGRRKLWSKGALTERPLVSVIVPFRNEARHLPLLLTSLQKQTYGVDSFEVILINDHSDDNSVEVLESFIAETTLTIKLLNNIAQGKKEAVQSAIARCEGSVILQTDADCSMSPKWIESMIKSTKGGELVLGGVLMRPDRGFWSAFAALDFMSLQASGVAMALLQKPIMGSAANLMYSKRLHARLKVKGQNNPSGDDVFLIQAAEEAGATVAININKEAMVKTEAPSSFKALIAQRTRWGGKTPSYPSGLAKAIALLVAIYALWCVALLIVGLFAQPVLQLFVFMMAAKALFDYGFLKSFSKATGQQGLMKAFPSAALAYPFYITVTLAAIAFSKQTWKGRVIQ